MPETTINTKTRGYQSTFTASPEAERVLLNGRIIEKGEKPRQMIERVVDSIAKVDAEIDLRNDTDQFADALGRLLDEKRAVMSTPVMTNAGRYMDRPLTACNVPHVSLRNLMDVNTVVNAMHEDGMGTGFNLDEVDDPIATLLELNRIACDGAESGREDRPVGNMALLSVYSPSILEFINLKVGADARNENWKFNNSITVDAHFIAAVKDGSMITLSNGHEVPARSIMDAISKASWRCADPGLIFLNRMNEQNPLPLSYAYQSVAPCAEVGLSPGETCQFGYLNLGKFVMPDKYDVDYEQLGEAVKVMTRALDSALELSIQNFRFEENRNVMNAKRKIGVGVCGLADMLIELGIPYNSQKGREKAKEVIAWINYTSKIASHELGEIRGSFGAINNIDCRHTSSPSYIKERFAAHPTKMVTTEMWHELGERIRSSRKLRNVSTIALPPTGRSGLVIDASTGVEPIFRVDDYGIRGELERLLQFLGNRYDKAIPAITRSGSIGSVQGLNEQQREVFKTATEISPEDHLYMAAAIQEQVDESISKTINLPASATPEEIARIYVLAYDLGLKGITIYRSGSREERRKLSSTGDEGLE